MGAPIGYQLWLWFKSNPWAQAAAVIGAAYVTFRIWLASKVKRERREAAEEAREEVIEQIEEQTDEAIQRVEDDRAAVADLNAAELRRLAASSPNNRGRLQNPEAD
jgi:lipopolysaccharide export LptBFGC system permease protein LptF